MLFRTATLVAAIMSTVVAINIPGGVGYSYPADAPTHQLYERTGTTGCSCNGYNYYIQGRYNGVSIPLLYKYGFVVPGLSTTNQAGWCFQNGVMMPTFQNYITTAMSSGVQSQYVNASWARAYCDNTFGAGFWTASQCSANLVSVFTNLIIPNYIPTCTYPTTTTNWIPTDCKCAFSCTNGYTQCGTECINPTTQTCVSGVPKNRRRDMKGRFNGCPEGQYRCPTGRRRGESECIDINTHLEACGACPFDDASVDCTAIPGATDVQCVQGRCIVSSCDRRHKFLNGTCVADASSHVHARSGAGGVWI